jgi:hypothetical protein
MSFINRLVSAILSPVHAIMSVFSRLVPGLKKLPTISVPARYAFLVFFLLLIVFVVLNLRFWNDPAVGIRGWTYNVWTILLTILLFFLIPFVVYLALDQLLRRELAPFPDIQKAWQAGLIALEDAGINLKTTPIFLVIGTRDESTAIAFHQAGNTSLNIENVPPGNAPIEWFGNDSAVFIHFVGASCVSQLINSSQSKQADSSDLNTVASYTGTIVGGMPSATPQTDVGNEESGGTGTITGDAPPTERPLSSSPAQGPPEHFRPTQTIGADHAPAAAGLPSEEVERYEITHADLETQIKRLRYACTLLKKSRQPICPLNGVVTLIPFSAIESSNDQIQIALQDDLETIEATCNLRCPITILVNEIEKESGFSELMRRIDREHVKNGRIGSRYGNADTDIWTPMDAERVKAMASNACKNIEDNILGFFRRDDALTRRGNGQLFILLSKLRGGFSTEFTNMWIASLARLKSMMVGCYFVAVGDTEDRQGFVANVINEKVIPSRGKLSWDKKAIAENNRYLLASGIFALVALASLIWLVGMLINDYSELVLW